MIVMPGGALVWTLISLFVVISSAPTLVPVLIVVCLCIPGVGYFAYMLKFDREVLETEPGSPEVLTAPVR